MMHTTWLLMIMSVGEIATGGAFVVVPSAAAEQLLGSPLNTSSAVTIGRVAGVALVALGIVCGLARRSKSEFRPMGIIAGMLIYNLGVAAVLSAAAVVSHVPGMALWTACVLHYGLAIWCAACLMFPSTTRA